MIQLDDWPCLMSLFVGNDQEQRLGAVELGLRKTELCWRRLELPKYGHIS